MVWGRRKKTGTEPISSKARKGNGAWVLIVVSVVFFFVGAGLFFGVFLGQLRKANASRNWPEVPCGVLSSEVKSHSGDDGATYSVEIRYQYEIDGRAYTSDRYTLMHVSSSGYEGKKAVVDKYPPGTETFCYVNPENPAEAVLKPGLGFEALFGLIPLVFILVGVGGVIGGVRLLGRGQEPAPWLQAGGASHMPQGREASASAGGRVVLKECGSPLTKLIGVFIFACIWNGVISFLVVHVVGGFRSGNPEWLPTLFSLPFVAVGLLLIGGVVYGLLALFNPRPRLTLSAATIPLGGAFDLEWEMSGSVHRIRRMRILLKGAEKATYTRGTKTYTDTETFYEFVIAEPDSPLDMRSGQMGVVIPANTMHSFKSDHNEILWSLQVKGEIDRWPDVDSDFPVLVVPQSTAGGAAA